LAAITSRLGEVHGCALSLTADLGIVQSLSAAHRGTRRVRLRVFSPATLAIHLEQEFVAGDTILSLAALERFGISFGQRARPNGELASVLLQPFYEFTGI